MKATKMFPEIVGPVAESSMIQRGGPHQTGKKDAQWLTRLPNGELGWSGNVFSALGFRPDQEDLLQEALEIAQTEDLPVATDAEEGIMATC